MTIRDVGWVRTSALAAATVVAGAAVAGCTSSASKPASPSASGTAAGSSGAPATATPGGSGGSTAPTRTISAHPTTPKATATFSVLPSVPVSTRPPVPITASATFTPGFTAKLIAHRQTTVRDKGPGAMTGADATAFSFAFVNHTGHRVAIGSVQVNVTYGDDLAASPVNLDSGAAKGSVPVGGRRTATYSFAIPKDQLRHVVISVSVESKYPTVVFSGSVA